MLKNLGPKKKLDIPLEVYMDNDIISNDMNDVIKVWRQGFENLYQFIPNQGEFNDEFYHKILKRKSELEDLDFPTDILNGNISVNEIRRIVFNLKNRKAVGTDNLPNEILKNEVSVQLLSKLFDWIFVTGIIPTLWTFAIIKPIPKNSQLDPRLPSNYRGISLLSTVYKCFASVINERLVDFC